jgi:hypothetical protein
MSRKVQLISAIQVFLLLQGAATFLFEFPLIFARLENIDLVTFGVKGKREGQWVPFILMSSNESERDSFSRLAL